MQDHNTKTWLNIPMIQFNNDINWKSLGIRIAMVSPCSARKDTVSKKNNFEPEGEKYMMTSPCEQLYKQ
jgi:hypothetical protein